MKNSKENRKDIDATAAWLMEQYRLAVQEALEAETDDEEMPEELDKKCRELIRSHAKKQRSLRVAKKAGRVACAAALTVVMLFGVAGILFTTVEAVRAPIIRFFTAQKEGYLEITDPGKESDTDTLTNEADFAEMNARFAELLPEAYVQTDESVSSMGNTSAIYENPEGKAIIFCANSYRGVLRFDVENAASAENITIGTHEAILVEKNGYRLEWLDTGERTLYQIIADSLSREEIIRIANTFENTRGK